jgi:hypothetical protein
MTRRRLRTLAVLAAVVMAGAAFGLYWFQPWKLFTSKRIADPVPAVAPAGSAPGGATAGPVARLLASGAFVSHEHSTRGRAQLVLLPDGRRQLLLLGLSTSDGPDLRVWLTDRPVSRSGWHTFDDGRYVEVARLKGNEGNQAYDLPAGTDLAGLRSVTIWCRRFAVSFGAAPLNRG